MSETLPVRDQVEREIEELLNKKHQQRLIKYDRDALAWLALVPAWTGQLAKACKFPSKQPLLDFLDLAQDDGYCQLSRSKDPKRSAWYDAYVRTHLAPYLPIGQQRKVVAFVQQISDVQLRAQAIATLATRLPRTSYWICSRWGKR